MQIGIVTSFPIDPKGPRTSYVQGPFTLVVSQPFCRAARLGRDSGVAQFVKPLVVDTEEVRHLVDHSDVDLLDHVGFGVAGSQDVAPEDVDGVGQVTRIVHAALGEGMPSYRPSRSGSSAGASSSTTIRQFSISEDSSSGMSSSACSTNAANRSSLIVTGMVTAYGLERNALHYDRRVTNDFSVLPVVPPDEGEVPDGVRTAVAGAAAISGSVARPLRARRLRALPPGVAAPDDAQGVVRSSAPRGCGRARADLVGLKVDDVLGYAYYAVPWPTTCTPWTPSSWAFGRPPAGAASARPSWPRSRRTPRRAAGHTSWAGWTPRSPGADETGALRSRTDPITARPHGREVRSPWPTASRSPRSERYSVLTVPAVLADAEVAPAGLSPQAWIRADATTIAPASQACGPRSATIGL